MLGNKLAVAPLTGTSWFAMQHAPRCVIVWLLEVIDSCNVNKRKQQFGKMTIADLHPKIVYWPGNCQAHSDSTDEDKIIGDIYALEFASSQPHIYARIISGAAMWLKSKLILHRRVKPYAEGVRHAKEILDHTLLRSGKQIAGHL